MRSEACLAFKTLHTHLRQRKHLQLWFSKETLKVKGGCLSVLAPGEILNSNYFGICVCPCIRQFSFILSLCLTWLSQTMWLRASLSTCDCFSLSRFCVGIFKETCGFGPPVLTGGRQWLAGFKCICPFCWLWLRQALKSSCIWSPGEGFNM